MARAQARRWRRVPFLKRLPRREAFIVALILLALLIFADQRGWLLVPRDADLETYDGRTFTVLRVIDGDTIDIAHPDVRSGETFTRVRLWGIDCPEMGFGGSEPEPWAEQATAFVRTLCEGREVTLHIESHRVRDKYDRLLAFVLLDERDVSEALLGEGLAQLDERWRHRKMAAFREERDAARVARAGLWSNGPRNPRNPRNAPDAAVSD